MWGRGTHAFDGAFVYGGRKRKRGSVLPAVVSVRRPHSKREKKREKEKKRAAERAGFQKKKKKKVRKRKRQKEAAA